MYCMSIRKYNFRQFLFIFLSILDLFFLVCETVVMNAVGPEGTDAC